MSDRQQLIAQLKSYRAKNSGWYDTGVALNTLIKELEAEEAAD